jgi:uncharacterized membrane protein
MDSNKTQPTAAANNAGTSERARAIEHETQKNISKIVEFENSEREKRTSGERISEAIAGFCGSMTFVWVHVFWFSSWVIVNQIPSIKFDPFPYTFLTLVVSLEAIFLSTFILISQNHDTRMSERRNHLDLQINLLAEQESTTTLELLRLVAQKVGVQEADPTVDVLTEDVRPDELAKQIMTATEQAMDDTQKDDDSDQAG